MTNDDLTEDIAKHLKTAGDGYWNEFGAAPNRTPWEAISPHAHEEYRAMAREVVRCMEWARHCAFKGEHWVDDPDEPGHRMLRDASELPLTLPPEGWKP